jgi:hypothetical protein
MVGVFSLEAVSCCSLRFPTCKEAGTVRFGSIPRAGAQHLGFSWKRDSRPLHPGVFAPALAGWKKSLAHGDTHPFSSYSSLQTNEEEIGAMLWLIMLKYMHLKKGTCDIPETVPLIQIAKLYCGLARSFAPGCL